MQQGLLNLVAWEYNCLRLAGFEGRDLVVKSGHSALARIVGEVRNLGILCLSATIRKQLSLLVSVVAGFGGLGVQLVEFRLALQHTVVVTSGQAVMARSMEAMGCLAILCLVVSLGRFNY